MPGTSSSDEAPPKIALLGGTFDPPHIGHLVLGECVRHQFGLEKVVFLPAGDPYRKAGRRVTPALQRLEMVRLATSSNAAFEVDDREVRRAGPTYTVETLESFRAQGVQRPLLVLGSDAVADMPNWKSPERLLELCRLVVAMKPGALAQWPEFVRPAPEIVDMPLLAISGTEIRARVAAGKPIRYLVPDAVGQYIRDHGLYLDRPALAGTAD